MFLRQLSAIPFSGGGFSDAAITEGLAEALMMFSSLNGSESHKKGDWTRHCVLIAASNPYPLPTAVYYPGTQSLEQKEDNKMHANHHLSDAETVARAFPQCSVSLSVISPRQLPKLKAIYDAGKRDPQIVDRIIEPSKNPNKFLLLISEDFIAACAVSRRTAPGSSAPDQSQVRMDTPSVPSVSGPPAASNPAVSAMSPQAGNIPASSISAESTTVTSITGPALPHIPTAQLVASLQSTSPISVSQEMVPDSENVKETKRIVSGTSESLLHPFSGAAAQKVRILNDVAQARQVLAGGTSIGVQSMGGTPTLPNMISGGMTGSLPSAEIGQTLAQNSVPASFASMAPYTCGNSNLSMSQMIPTPGMTQHVQLGLQPQRNSSTEEAGMPRSQQKTSATLPSARPNFTEFWEEMVPDSENVKEIKDIVSGTSESLLHPFSGAAAPKVRILNDVAQERQVLAGGTSIGVQSMGGIPILPNMISGGMTGSLPSAEIGQTLAQNSVPASFPSLAPYTCGTSNLSMSQMIPTPGTTQHVQPGLQPQRNSSTEEAGMSRSQQQTSARLPSAQPEFTEFWEGDLYGQKQSESVLMTRIKAYRIDSPSRTFENWPPGIKIVGLLELDYMNNLNVRRNSDVVVLRTLSDLHFFRQLLERKLCAVAELPSKKLLLAGTDKASRIIGLVVSRDTVLDAKPAVACIISSATSRAPTSTATSRAPTSGETPVMGTTELVNAKETKTGNEDGSTNKLISSSIVFGRPA